MTRRAGFGLVEVIIAALLIAGGVLTMAAAAVAVRTRIDAAAAEEAAIWLAAALLDSLRAETVVHAGSVEQSGLRASWHVVEAEIVLTTSFHAGVHGERSREYRIRSSARVPRTDAP
jgi:Tfp pilus assembly protein PilV